MNPVDWLKAIYETFGTPYPRISLAVVTALGAVLFFAVWTFAAKQAAKDHVSAAPRGTAGRSIGSASTSGPNSPIVSGSGNTFNYGRSEPSKTDKPASKKD